MAELDGAAARGELDEFATWKQTHELPYLSAVIAEAGRIHPPVGLHMEREVPAQGAVVCGQPLKGGTVVGMSAWVAHRDPSIFGDDCDKWNPERWLCDAEKRNKMDSSLITVGHAILSHLLPCVAIPSSRNNKVLMLGFQFGAGHRACLGKNVSLLEIHKAVPTLLRKFNVSAFSDCMPWMELSH